MTEFDLGRAVKEGCRTREGRHKAEAVWQDERSVIFKFTDEAGNRWAQCYGKEWVELERDLVNLPEAHEVTVQLCETATGGLALSVECKTIQQILFEEYRTKIWAPIGKPVTVRIEKDE